MLKIILPAAVLASIGLFVCDDASAGWRRDYRRSRASVTSRFSPASLIPKPTC